MLRAAGTGTGSPGGPHGVAERLGDRVPVRAAHQPVRADRQAAAASRAQVAARSPAGAVWHPRREGGRLGGNHGVRSPVGGKGRQRAAGTTVLVSIGVQASVFGVVGFTIFAASLSGRIWVATIFLLAFAAGALAGYKAALDHIDHIAIKRRESIIAALCRA